MKFENTQVFNFEGALRGMRNPMNSWDKSDSKYGCGDRACEDCAFKPSWCGCSTKYRIGDKDMKLAQQLIKAGSEHRKFMRQIFVSVDITAPLYWWKEFDTYKINTVANSTSTMHKLANTPITIDCFETDDYQPEFSFEALNGYIEGLEDLRQTYLKTKDKLYWKELIRWLPESWLQTRTITMNYENVSTMVRQRKNHKLNEWSGIDNPVLSNFISWARTLPYAQELIFIDEVDC